MCIYWYFTVSEGGAVSEEGLVLLVNYCHNGNMTITVSLFVFSDTIH